MRAARIELARYVVPEQAASHQIPNLARLPIPRRPHSPRWRVVPWEGHPFANGFLLNQVLLSAHLAKLDQIICFLS